MASRPLPMPAFGQADLSNCEREQIQLAGSIQPHGALLVVSEPDGVIVQASANAAEFLLARRAMSSAARSRGLGGNLCERIAAVPDGIASHYSRRGPLPVVQATLTIWMFCCIARPKAG